MVGIASNDEFFIGYTPDGVFEIIMRPVRLPMTGLRARSPPPPPPPPRTPSPPPPRTPLIRPIARPAIMESGLNPAASPFRPVNRVPPARPLPPRWARAPEGPWNSPPPPAYSPVGGLQVFEAEPCAMDMSTTRDQATRGVVRPHSESPFVRSTKAKIEDGSSEVGDMAEAVSCLLDFSKRRGLATAPPPPSEMVRTFSTSTPKKTPSPPPRPSSPPRLASRRILPMATPRPVPIRPAPSAALGAPPPREEEDESVDLPDIPENPLATIDLSMISSLDNYESEDGWVTMEEDDDSDVYSEYEYGDPYEDQGPWSTTPPPSCNTSTIGSHEVCVPPDWGERIPGQPIHCRCLLCHEEDKHHPIRCMRCKNAPGCCTCLWGYMRSKYNSGCPLCRHGDPKGDNPLAQRRPPNRRRVILGGMVVGTGRGRGRPRQQGDQQQEEEEEEREAGGRGRRGRGRRGRRLGR